MAYNSIKNTVSKNSKTNLNNAKSYNKNNYKTEGSLAKKIDVVEELKKPYKVKVSNCTKKNRDKALYMNMKYVLFLTGALFIITFILLDYIKIRSKLTVTMKNVAKMERELNDLKLKNNEDYNRISNSINLDEIKKIAIGELGMSYADEEHIIKVPTSNHSYVRQLATFENFDNY